MESARHYFSCDAVRVKDTMEVWAPRIEKDSFGKRPGFVMCFFGI